MTIKSVEDLVREDLLPGMPDKFMQVEPFGLGDGRHAIVGRDPTIEVSGNVVHVFNHVAHNEERANEICALLNTCLRMSAP